MTVCLGGVVISLLLVGIVSGTIIRHLIQISPLIMALTLVVIRPSWGSYASIAVFFFWLFIMIIIWLYLLKITQIISGHFSGIEISLTILIGCFSLLGIIYSMRLGSTLRLISRMAFFPLFAGIQFGAIVLSFHRIFANR